MVHERNDHTDEVGQFPDLEDDFVVVVGSAPWIPEECAAAEESFDSAHQLSVHATHTDRERERGSSPPAADEASFTRDQTGYEGRVVSTR
jgi:hypothetical protein